MTTAGGVRIGLDVGGTYTDAVVLDSALTVLAKAKVPTTEHVLDGVTTALTAVLGKADIPAPLVHHVMVSTTHATNAVIQRRGLRRVAVLRIGAPATLGVPILTTWPHDIYDAVVAGATTVRGGAEIDGEPIVPLDTQAVERFAASVRSEVDAFSLTGVFSPVAARDEITAREIIRSVCGQVPVSMSHEIGTIGLVDRESSTALNAALTAVAREVIDGVTAALTAIGIEATLYVAQNDGTLMSAESGLRFPVLTIGSGPASSMRGAAFLSDLDDAIVVDIGGTSTDVGVLTGGMPRASTSAIEVGGIRANFRMPDLMSVGLGGGSVVREEGTKVRVGPDSVGADLTTAALVFGGDVMTLSDAAVALGRMDIGDHRLSPDHDVAARQSLAWADSQFAESIERLQRSPEQNPVIVVGGAGGLLADLPSGCSELRRPEHHEVANAVGAAVAMISREVDEVLPAGLEGRQERIQLASQRARQRAIAAGADPGGVEIVDVHETPLAYLTNPAVRLRVKAAGPLPQRSLT